jgi:hypothetical protein
MRFNLKKIWHCDQLRLSSQQEVDKDLLSDSSQQNAKVKNVSV